MKLFIWSQHGLQTVHLYFPSPTDTSGETCPNLNSASFTQIQSSRTSSHLSSQHHHPPCCLIPIPTTTANYQPCQFLSISWNPPSRFISALLAGATLWLQWALGTSAFVGSFDHKKIFKVMFYDCWYKENIIQAGFVIIYSSLLYSY